MIHQLCWDFYIFLLDEGLSTCYGRNMVHECGTDNDNERITEETIIVGKLDATDNVQWWSWIAAKISWGHFRAKAWRPMNYIIDWYRCTIRPFGHSKNSMATSLYPSGKAINPDLVCQWIKIRCWCTRNTVCLPKNGLMSICLHTLKSNIETKHGHILYWKFIFQNIILGVPSRICFFCSCFAAHWSLSWMSQWIASGNSLFWPLSRKALLKITMVTRIEFTWNIPSFM